ncbi:MAG: carbohydrate ABC transporter permease, partial [Caldilinea sp.]
VMEKHYRPWLFLLPGVLLGLFTLGFPIVQSFWYSLNRIRMFRFSDLTFVGFENYARLWGDPLFLLSVRATLVFTIGCTVFSVLAGLMVAAVLNSRDIRKTFSARFLMAFYLVPFVATPIVVGILGRLFIWEPEYGLVNYLLGLIGISGTGWLLNRDTAMLATIITNVWRLTPLAILIFYAAMVTVPDELIESAEVDGAGWFTVVRRIILPIMTSAFREFDTVYSLTGGGPGRATNVLSIEVYNIGVSTANMGMANAIAFTMFIIVSVLSIIYIRLARLDEMGR